MEFLPPFSHTMVLLAAERSKPDGAVPLRFGFGLSGATPGERE
jgi:hypothetical protein